jgi:hypothetical protein
MAAGPAPVAGRSGRTNSELRVQYGSFLAPGRLHEAAGAIALYETAQDDPPEQFKSESLRACTRRHSSRVRAVWRPRLACCASGTHWFADALVHHLGFEPAGMQRPVGLGDFLHDLRPGLGRRRRRQMPRIARRRGAA